MLKRRDARKDEAIDRLLRGSLPAGRATAPQFSGECVDADTAAAWVEDRLDRAARARIERHAASCARCLEVVIALARTAPAAVAAPPWWKLPATGWLVSAAGAAAAIVLWFAMPPGTPEPPPAAASASVAAPASPPVDAVAPQVADARRARATEGAAAAPPVPKDSGRRDGLAPGGLETRSLKETPPQISGASQGANLADAAVGSVTVPPRSADSRAVAPAQPRVATRFSPQTVGWRFGGVGFVERSTDGGKTWERQPTGVDVELVAGSSPAPLVCWAVGRSGAVLLTTDGARWQQLPSPTDVDLVSVEATDATTAIVRAADGRTFRTIDSGRTWR
jgi:hypothetical protein